MSIRILLLLLILSGCSPYSLTNKQIYSVAKGKKAIVAIYMYGFADDIKKAWGSEVKRQHVEGTGIYSIWYNEKGNYLLKTNPYQKIYLVEPGNYTLEELFTSTLNTSYSIRELDKQGSMKFSVKSGEVLYLGHFGIHINPNPRQKLVISRLNQYLYARKDFMQHYPELLSRLEMRLIDPKG